MNRVRLLCIEAEEEENKFWLKSQLVPRFFSWGWIPDLFIWVCLFLLFIIFSFLSLRFDNSIFGVSVVVSTLVCTEIHKCAFYCFALTALNMLLYNCQVLCCAYTRGAAYNFVA